MTTTHGLPDPLPVRVRPTPGEAADSYIRRLAHANHLRPSLLHAYVRDPASPGGGIRTERLAAVSGRTPAAITHALTGLPTPRGGSRPRPPSTQAARKARLFPAIRADAARGLSIHAIATRHHTHRRTVHQALASPTPPPRKPRAHRPAPVLDPIRSTLDTLCDQPNLTTWQIWARLVDEHHSDVSYGTVRPYVRNRRTTH
jgi:hypothetical protein